MYYLNLFKQILIADYSHITYLSVVFIKLRKFLIIDYSHLVNY